MIRVVAFAGVPDGPLTLRELDAIPVSRLKGVGERRQASLGAVGVESVLDLLTRYPRRWVDRTNEARVSDLVPGREALVLVTVVLLLLIRFRPQGLMGTA